MGDDFHAERAFVAMFDILGFKALRRAKGTAAIAEYYEKKIYGALQDAKGWFTELTDNTTAHLSVLGHKANGFEP